MFWLSLEREICPDVNLQKPCLVGLTHTKSGRCCVAMNKWVMRGLLSTGVMVGMVFAEVGRSPLARSAEYLQVDLGLLSLSIPVEDLEKFAETGEVTDEISVYLNYLPPEARGQFREVLTRQFEVSPLAVSQVTYASIGQDFLGRLGEIVKTPAGLSGAKALRAALILSASDPEGISVLEIFQEFPTEGIHVDVGRLLDLQNEVSSYFSYQDTVLEVIATQSAAEAAETAAGVNRESVPDLSDRGSISFTQAALTLNNRFPDIPPDRARTFEVDLYIPQTDAPTIPLVVISHGLGSNRSQFSSMAEHLASYGFAVAVPEHPGSDTSYQQEFLANIAYDGLDPYEFVYRPWDIKSVIDALAEDPVYRRRLDLDDVGVIGHSFGGYTALALVGAPLNQDYIAAQCSPVEYVLNLSTLLQCRANQLPLQDYQLADERISAAIAYSPVTSLLFGPESLAQIEKPVMIVAGSNDFVAPAIPEQVHPFIWLASSEKYLATFVSASHVSVNGEIDFGAQIEVAPQVSSLLTGPAPNLSTDYAHALNAAFMGVYLGVRPEYQQFLGAAYAQEFLSKEPVQLRVVSELTADQLISAYGGQPPIPIFPPPGGNRH